MKATNLQKLYKRRGVQKVVLIVLQLHVDKVDFNGLNSDGSFTLAGWNYHYGLYRSKYA